MIADVIFESFSTLMRSSLSRMFPFDWKSNFNISLSIEINCALSALILEKAVSIKRFIPAKKEFVSTELQFRLKPYKIFKQLGTG